MAAEPPPLNVDEFTAYIAQATGLNIKVSSSHASTSVPHGMTAGGENSKDSRDHSRLPRNKKEMPGKVMYGDTNGHPERTTTAAEGSGPVQGLSGMFSGLMTAIPNPPEDHRINHTNAVISNHFHSTDRSKQLSGYHHHSEESSEMDDTMGRKDTRRGGRTTRGT